MRAAIFTSVLLSLVPTVGSAQILELYRPPDQELRDASGGNPANVCGSQNTVAALERGMLDMTSQGQAQASAQLVRICIGEPGKFALPIYVLAGATGGAAGAEKAADATASTLLNPLGGNLAMLYSDGYELVQIAPHTFAQATISVGARYFQATDSTGAGVPLVVGTFSGGLRLQTAAWSPDDAAKGVGTAWLQLAVAFDVASQGRLATIFGPNATSWASSVSFDLGVKVAGRLDAKLSLYHALNDHGIAALRPAVLKAGFDFGTSQ